MARLNRVKSFRGTTKTASGNLTCGKCRDEITKGDGYVWWANRLPGSRSGTKNVRCLKPGCHPKPSEMTPGRRGELMSIQEDVSDALSGEGLTLDDIQSIAEDAAERVREIATGLEESADNIGTSRTRPTCRWSSW